MSTSTETLIKKYETSAKNFERKGKRYWAYAKNGKGDEYYGKAKVAYRKADINRDKAELLKKQVENSGPVIKPNNFAGNICKTISNPGMMAAGITAISESTKAITNGDTVERATSNVVSKSMESAVNASIAHGVAKIVTSAIAASNPIVATTAYITTTIATDKIVSEVTEGSFDKVGKKMGDVAGNIGYSVSEGISEFQNNVKRVAENVGWATSNALSNFGMGIKNLLSW